LASNNSNSALFRKCWMWQTADLGRIQWEKKKVGEVSSNLLRERGKKVTPKLRGRGEHDRLWTGRRGGVL